MCGRGFVLIGYWPISLKISSFFLQIFNISLNFKTDKNKKQQKKLKFFNFFLPIYNVGF